MSPDRPVTSADTFMSVRRRALCFSLLLVLLLVAALGVLRPRGIADAAAVTQQMVWVDAPLSASDITWRHGPALFAAGLTAGLFTGMLGMGGGVFKIAFLLLLFKLDIFFARAISVMTMFFSSSVAVWRYVQTEMVVWRIATPMLLLGLPAAVLAAVVGNALHGATLETIFGVFVIFLSLNTLALVFADPEERLMLVAFDQRSARPNEGYHCATVGMLHGATCGLLGISGGVIATPLQQLLLHIPLRHAIGNTLLVSTGVTLTAGFVVIWAGVQAGDFGITDLLFVDLFMGAGVALGAPLGTRLGARCNITMLRILFVLLTMGAGIGIIW